MLAQILAILSGAWIVGAGIYGSLTMDMIQLVQNELTFASNAFFQNHSDISTAIVSNYSKPMIESLVDTVGITSVWHRRLFKWGIGFGIASLFIWLLGSMRPSGKFSKQNS